MIRNFGINPIADVKMLEKKYDLKLSNDYFEFLCNVGGGIVEKTNNEIYIEDIKDVISIDVLFGLNTAYKNANIEMWTDKYYDEIPRNTIIIGDTLEHGFVVMLCLGEDAGIYYWDDTYHFECSNDENNTYFIADTFTEFAKKLLE